MTQLVRVARIFEAAGFHSKASHRAIAGVAFDLRGRYQGQPIYAPEENIPKIIRVARAAGSIGLGTCIHFNGATLQVQEHEVLDFLGRLDKNNGLPSILQLNGQPPHPSVLQAIRKQFPREQLLLAIQVKPETNPDRVDGATQDLQDKYLGLVDYLNMNSSAGTGTRFSIHERWRAFVALWRAFPDVSIGLPGGLSAENAQAVCAEIDTVLNTQGRDDPSEGLFVFCTDAEGQLKFPDGPLEGHLDLRRAGGYVLGAAAAILQGARPPY